MSKRPKITIGDVGISIEANDCGIPPVYRPFIGPGKTDISLRVHQGVPEASVGDWTFTVKTEHPL